MGAIFQQDNTPCNKAKKLLDFLEVSEDDTLKWSHLISNLSVIEKLVGASQKQTP